MTTYTVRASAVRAAKKEFNSNWKEYAAIIEVDGRWTWKGIETPKAEIIKKRYPHKAGTVTAHIFNICDKYCNMARKDIVGFCIEEGINPGSARTGYQMWRSANK